MVDEEQKYCFQVWIHKTPQRLLLEHFRQIFYLKHFDLRMARKRGSDIKYNFLSITSYFQ